MTLIAKQKCWIPKFELGEFMYHSEGSGFAKATGDKTDAKVEQADGYEPPVQKSV